MVTELDGILPQVALETLEEFGKDAVFTIEPDNVEDDYDPATGKFSVSVPTTETIKISPPFPFDKKLVDGDLILATDLMTIIAAQGLTFTPITTQKVTFDGQTYTIVTVTPLLSGELTAAFELQLRALNAN